MKGNKKIIACLNQLLVNELTAADQYFTHSRMYHDWGFDKIFQRLNHEMEEETEHADLLIKRILFLEGVPDLSKRHQLTIGANVQDMMTNDLALEMTVVRDVRAAIALCEHEHDYQSRVMLEKLLIDTEEDHVYWLEQQLGMIDKVGLANYLQSQMG